MYKTHTQQSALPARNHRRECCTDAPCDSGLRNQYFEGKRLTADSFRVEQEYALDRRRLLNRAIHGWGVVYGYALKPAPAKDGHTQSQWGRLQIGAGLALDECGRELLHTRPTSLGFDDVTLIDKKGRSIKDKDGSPIKRPPEGSYEPRNARIQDGDERPQACWLLSVHYAEQLVGPIKISDPCSCERNEWDHVCETVRFSLRQVDCEACCKAFECELECGCGTCPCCGEHAAETRPEQQSTVGSQENNEQCESSEPSQISNNPVNRGGCQCLCEHLTGLQEAECGGLREIEDACAHIRADLCHGVPLACVSLREGECDGEWLFDRWVDACGPRRLVKRNDALFDLIRGCDLTRISGIGWECWHRVTDPVQWKAFKDSFGTEKPPESGRNPTTQYWVEFSRPVRKDTVRADCFSMTVIAAESEGGWGIAHRVPILDVETVDAPGPQSGLVTKATLVVDSGWVADAIQSRKRIFNQDETIVEIEIRGDFIIDCNGQAVDANAVGRTPSPTGNGTPGGTFHSTFRVQPSGPGGGL